MTSASDDLMVMPFGPAPIRGTCLASSPSFLNSVTIVGLTEGQTFSRDLGDIPLPEDIASRSLAAVARIPGS